jgi:hypothetical protein
VLCSATEEDIKSGQADERFGAGLERARTQRIEAMKWTE